MFDVEFRLNGRTLPNLIDLAWVLFDGRTNVLLWIESILSVFFRARFLIYSWDSCYVRKFAKIALYWRVFKS